MQRSALETAIANVRRFAETQRPASSRTVIVPGVELERRWLPVSRVGAYVPGGSAPYPSSLVMTVVPAQVAGVAAIVVASPADRGGAVDPVLLGAAGLLGVDGLLVAGGVQAIGALAFGLPDAGLPPADLVVGPGSAWVTAAKVELAGEVAIDLPAGPSEGLVLADASADPSTVAADLITQAEHGVDSPALLVTFDEAFADAVEADVRRRLATALRRDILARALADHGRIVLVDDLDAGIAFVDGYGPEHLSIDLADAEAAVSRIRNAGSIFVGRWSPESAGDYASGANHVLPTGGLARACGPLAVETYGKFSQVQRITREGLAALRPTIRTLAEAEGLLAHRDAVEARFDDPATTEARPMSPSPFSVSSPTDPASYSWEATDEGVAERFGIPISQVLRFDLNTSPAPPALLAGLLAAGRFETPLSEYPPGDYRRLVEAAAAAYGVTTDELVPGAGADEILDMCTKAFLPAGEAAVVSVPTYPMYRIHAEQRGGRVIAVPRLGRDDGWAMDLPAVRRAAREATLVWICNPNNPTGRAEPDGAVERLLADIDADAAADGRAAPAVVVDEAYSEFSGVTVIGLRTRYPNLVVVRTASKAYALAGLRVGFAIATADTVRRIAPYRPPGSISTISATAVTAALRDEPGMRANVERVERERPRLVAALEAAGWRPQPSVTNFVLLDLVTPERAEAAALALMARGLVPRTFGHGHPLAYCLRVTIRTPDEDDRLIAAAAEIAPTLPPVPALDGDTPA